jgi:hypothetical protein
MNSMPPLEKLIQWDAEKAAFCDANGRPFTNEDLEDLFFIARKIDLLEKLEQSDVDGVNTLFNEHLKKIEDKANIKPKKLAKIKKVAGQLCGHAFRPKEIEKSIDFIIENAEKYDNGLLCHKSQQLYKISKIFDHMKDTLELPDAESIDKYEYDENNGKLVISGGNIHRRFYHITTKSTAEAVEKFIGKSLTDDCDLIDAEIEKMQNIDQQTLEYVDRQIQAVHASYVTFYEKIGQTNKGNEIQPKVEQLINDYQVKLTKFLANLQSRLVVSM